MWYDRKKGGISVKGIQQEVRRRSAVSRGRSPIAGLMAIPLMMLLYSLLFPSGEMSPVTLSPARWVERRSDGAVLCLAEEDFCLYYLPEEGEAVPRAFVRRVGVWVLDWPLERKEEPVSRVEGTVYCYGSRAEAARAVDEGGRVYLPVTCPLGAVFALPAGVTAREYEFEGLGRFSY